MSCSEVYVGDAMGQIYCMDLRKGLGTGNATTRWGCGVVVCQLSFHARHHFRLEGAKRLEVYMCVIRKVLIVEWFE